MIKIDTVCTILAVLNVIAVGFILMEALCALVEGFGQCLLF